MNSLAEHNTQDSPDAHAFSMRDFGADQPEAQINKLPFGVKNDMFRDVPDAPREIEAGRDSIYGTVTANNDRDSDRD